MTDKRFARSVIYMCAHSAEGAMGLIVNQRASHISFSRAAGTAEHSPPKARTSRERDLIDIDVHVGGPVETGRGFVLHSSDYFAADSTLAIDDGVSLTATVDILKAIAGGKRPGPRDPGARLCGLAAGPAGERDPGQRLAALSAPISTCCSIATSTRSTSGRCRRSASIRPIS